MAKKQQGPAPFFPKLKRMPDGSALLDDRELTQRLKEYEEIERKAKRSKRSRKPAGPAAGEQGGR